MMMVEAVAQTAKCLMCKREDQTYPQFHIHIGPAGHAGKTDRSLGLDGLFMLFD